MSCSNFLKINEHIFGLYRIIGFRDSDHSPIDGCWDGVIYIRNNLDYTTSFPNNIKTQETIDSEQIPETSKKNALNDTVLVADDLKDIIINSYLNKELLLLEITEFSVRKECSINTYKAISAVLPFSQPIISKKILKTKISI